MTKGDQTVESAADKLETFVKQRAGERRRQGEGRRSRWPTTRTSSAS